MKLPIIISSGLDVSFYMSLEFAQVSIEPADVLNGIYTIYDSGGNFLDANVVESSTGNQVKINLTDRTDATTLMELLRDFLTEVGSNRNVIETMNLEHLIELCMVYFRTHR